MRRVHIHQSVFVICLGVFGALVLLAPGLQGAAKKAPEKLVLEAKTGKVTFNHAKHAAREKNNCKACHGKIFPQSRAPLNYGQGMHKPAETKKAACANCHVAGGKAFESKGNCNKCHGKA